MVRCTVAAVVVVVVVAADAGCSGDNVNHLADTPARLDASGVGGDGVVGHAGSLVVTQSPPGPQNGDMATWSGVLQYTFAGYRQPLVEIAGVDKGALADPVGLAFHDGELFVGNRHGNNGADGVSGSISRFTYSPSTHALTPNGRSPATASRVCIRSRSHLTASCSRRTQTVPSRASRSRTASPRRTA